MVGQSLLPIMKTDNPEGSNLYRAYLGAEAGYRFRAEKPADQLLYFLAAGYFLSRGLWVKGEVDGVEGLSAISGGVDESYTIARVGLNWGIVGSEAPIGEQGNVSVGVAYGRTIRGENTAVGNEYILRALISF
jgi:TPP-dependent pyruvate/acetoin dehydrogenase alpha subunit